MSGKQSQQQQSGTPGVFATPAGASTPRRISDQFTPATGFRGPPIYQQSRGRGSGSGGTPATRVGFANPIVGGSNAPAGGGTANVGQQGHGSGGLGRQASKFVRATDVDDADMLDVDVALQKENYGEPGSSDYRKNMAMATAALYEKFGVARHKIVTSGEEGDQTKHQYVQQVIVGILHRVKEGHQRSRKMDWMDICMVADYSRDIENPDCVNWWGEEEINIWTDWELLSEQQVRAWQYSINKRFSDGDRIASTWLKEFVYASSTDSLRSAVEKKYDRLEPNQRGGVMYLYFTLCEMFQMSREVKDAMLTFLDLFKRKGVARYTGENMILVSEEVLGVSKRLDSVRALQEEHVIDVLTGLTICGNSRFRGMFEHLKQSADFDHLEILSTVSATSTPLEKIEAILEKAVDTYDMLCTAGLWLPNTSKGGRAALNSIVQAVNACWNCGETGHSVGKCPKPKDQEKIAKNRQAFYDSKGSNSSGGGKAGGSGGGTGKGRGKGGKNVDKSNPEYQRKVWEANGIHMVNGALMIKCAKCGLNTTHSTKLHDTWEANPSTFKLPDTNFYAKECAKLAQKSGTGTAPPPAPATSGSTSGSASAAGMISMNRSELEAKLTQFERNSTDPNASSVSEAIRALLLN